MDRKVQKLFDSIEELGDSNSKDGRDRCISKAVIDKLSKLGFELVTDEFLIDKNYKNLFTGEITSDVIEMK
jgi:hypothetical protein